MKNSLWIVLLKNMDNTERTIIRGFHNRDHEAEHEPTDTMVSTTEEPKDEGINVTWVFWLMGGMSVASLIISIISLVIACR